MKKSIQYLILYGCFSLGLSACSNPLNFGLDLQEKAHFHQNGSGNFEITFSLERACKIIALGEYMAQEYINFVKLIIVNTFLSTSKNLKYIPGISQVKVSHGPNMLRFKLSFQFRDIKSLNQAMQALYLNVDPPQTVYFKTKNNILVRKDTAGLTRLAHYYQGTDDSTTKSFDIEFFLRNMRYTVQYSFDQPIHRVSNPLASMATDHKSVTLVHEPFRKKEKKLSISNKITFHHPIIK